MRIDRKVGTVHQCQLGIVQVGDLKLGTFFVPPSFQLIALASYYVFTGMQPHVKLVNSSAPIE